MDPVAFMVVAAACAPLVDASTARAVVQVESAFNEHAIGIVGGQLERQPRGPRQAIAMAQALESTGRNFSVGLAQINRYNFARLGLTVPTAFEPCSNLAAMQVLLLDCFDRASRGGTTAQRSLRRALSCYYSGNFSTGFQHGYTRRVVQAATSSAARPPFPLRPTKESS